MDFDALENDVYDHLFSFFRRYYSEGDFLAKRVYKQGVYTIPYEGEEVTLHWTNEDQNCYMGLPHRAAQSGLDTDNAFGCGDNVH